MTFDRISRGMALIGIVSVLTVFLFPAMQGPYSAVNGPVTALQGARAATGSRMAIVRAAQNIVGMYSSPAPTTLCATDVVKMQFPAERLLAGGTTLRC